MKERLYYQDAYTVEFTAVITQSGQDANGYYVELDQTAFYPTGGGQPCDLGTIDHVDVTLVEEVDGQVRHYLSSPLAPSTSAVQGKIDWKRRFDHMQQHAGQHILSASFEEAAGIATIGFHLGREIVTIDLDTQALSSELIRQAEDLANQVVAQNLPIEARFVDQQEIASLPVRKAPTVEENIRLVTIPGFDYNPCGGIHPRRTGEVGMIKLLGWEKNKGKVRLSFISGFRVLEFTRRQQSIVQQVTRLLTCTEADLADQVSRILDEQKETVKRLQEAKLELQHYEQIELLQQAEQKNGIKIVSKVYQDRTMQELQRLAQQVTTSDKDCLVLLLSVSDKCQLVFARGENLSIDVAKLLKQVLPLVEGKGGGKPELAQGGGSLPADPQTLLNQARTLIDQ